LTGTFAELTGPTPSALAAGAQDVAVGYSDGSINIFATGSTTAATTLPPAAAEAVDALAIAEDVGPEKRTMVVAAHGTKLDVWHADRAARLESVTLAARAATVATTVAGSAPVLEVSSASPGTANNVVLYRPAAIRALNKPGDAAPVGALAVVDTNLVMAVGNKLRTVPVEVGDDTGKDIADAGEPVVALAALMTGKVVSASASAVKVWNVDVSTPTPPTATFDVFAGSGVTAVSVTAAGNTQVAAGLSNGDTRILTDQAVEQFSLKGHTDGARVGFVGRTAAGPLVTAGKTVDGGALKLWSVNPSIPTPAHTDRVYGLAWKDDGTLFTTGQDGKVGLWVASSASTLTVKRTDAHGTRGTPAVSNRVFTAAVRKDLLATGGQDRLVRVWTISPSNDLTVRADSGTAVGGSVSAVAFLADDNLVCGSVDTKVRVFDIVPGPALTLNGTPLIGHTDEVTGVAVHPSTALRAATVSLDGSVVVRDLGTTPAVAASATLTVGSNTEGALGVAWNPSGSILAVAGRAGRVFLFKAP
jgi:hypothetical protein